MDDFNERIVVELTELESLGINLPATGKIGAGIRFDETGWFFPDAGVPEIGSSPGGNWVDNSFLERNDVEGLPWRLAIADPTPTGPGVGSYTLFETSLATPNDPTGNSSVGVGSDFYTGVGFRVERTTHLKEVGGWMRGSGTIFAAVVELGQSQFGLPDPPDLTGDDVLGTTLIELPGPSAGFGGQDVSAELDLVLEPGAYALLFGAGRFGADPDPDASLRSQHLPNGNWSEYSIRQSDGARFFQGGKYRIFAAADSAPGTVQVRPSFDAQAEVTRGTFGDLEGVLLIDGEDSISVDQSSVEATPDEIAVLEFSLDDVPSDRDLLAVDLEIDLNSATFSVPNRFEVYGYAGDGAAGLQDAVTLEDLIGVFSIDGSGIASVNLDAVFVSDLLGQASHLGLAIVSTDTSAFGFNPLEGWGVRRAAAPHLQPGRAPRQR